MTLSKLLIVASALCVRALMLSAWVQELRVTGPGQPDSPEPSARASFCIIIISKPSPALRVVIARNSEIEIGCN